MDQPTIRPPTGSRRFFSLKWKAVLVLSVALAMANAAIGYLVYLRTTGQFEMQQTERRSAQIRELRIVLANDIESISTFASFIPALSAPGPGSEVDGLPGRIARVLERHGLMLNVEWGVEGIHFFSAGSLGVPEASWPAGRRVPGVGGLLHAAWREEAPRGRLICDNGCAQAIALPLLDAGATAGLLLIERSVADSLKAFHQLSGADLALLDEPASGTGDDDRMLGQWRKVVAGITHEATVLPVLERLVPEGGLDELAETPRRVRYGSDWYEVYAIPASAIDSDVALLVVNRVTGQLAAIRQATADSLKLGLVGMSLSELLLLALMWGPMQRIHDVVSVLPLLADKSYARLRDELASRERRTSAGDEIDVMVDAINAVSQQIEVIDEARSAAGEALRASEHSLKLAQSMAKVATWVGQPLDGVFEVTQGAERIDAALEAVTSWEDFLVFVHPEDKGRVRVAWRRAQAGSLMDVEFRLAIGRREINVHAMAEFEATGPARILRGIGMLQDVTGLRAAERALKNHRDLLEQEVLERTAELVAARNEAQRLARTKSRFLADMSHEIRTPLNAMLGLSQIGMQHNSDPRVSETFGQILEAGEHLLNVVNDVLDLTRLEAGKLTIEAKPFDLRDAVRQCTDMLSQRVQAKRLQMPVRIAEELPALVVGDGFRVQQILINLLGNAVKFTEQGSIVLEVYPDRDRICFVVRDTGIGMAVEQVARLFTPFYQAGHPETAQSEGSGLGLSISNRLAIMMGGEIRVQSQPGVGSEFTLYLPLVDGRGSERMTNDAVHTRSDSRRLLGMRVLVVDDVKINRTVIEALLEAEGARVEGLADGQHAVDRVLGGRGQGVDLVLMDVHMPGGMDGREATRRIRAAGRSVPVIGVTAHVSAEERAASLAAGMNDQLVKPVMRETLVAAVLRVAAPAEAGSKLLKFPR